MLLLYVSLLITALFLSALKSQGIPYIPASIKRAIEGTAASLGQHPPFSIGHGVIQVCKSVALICLFLCYLN